MSNPYEDEVLDDFEQNPEDWEAVAQVPPADADAPRPKVTVALRLEAHDVDRIRELAEAEGVGYTTLLRKWVQERLDGPRRTHDSSYRYAWEKSRQALRQLTASAKRKDLDAAALYIQRLIMPPGRTRDRLHNAASWSFVLAKEGERAALVEQLMNLLEMATLGLYGIEDEFQDSRVPGDHEEFADLYRQVRDMYKGTGEEPVVREQ